MKPSEQIRKLERDITTSKIKSIFDIKREFDRVVKNTERLETKLELCQEKIRYYTTR